MAVLPCRRMRSKMPMEMCPLHCQSHSSMIDVAASLLYRLNGLHRTNSDPSSLKSKYNEERSEKIIQLTEPAKITWAKEKNMKLLYSSHCPIGTYRTRAQVKSLGGKDPRTSSQVSSWCLVKDKAVSVLDAVEEISAFIQTFYSVKSEDVCPSERSNLSYEHWKFVKNNSRTSNVYVSVIVAL